MTVPPLETGLKGSRDHKARILIAKPGIDDHDYAIFVLARGLRDAGYEVIWQGLHQFPEAIVAAAIQEDVDFLFLSSHTGVHMAVAEELMPLLRENGADDIVVAYGGCIPHTDEPALRALGVAAVFEPGVSMSKVIEFVEGSLRAGTPARGGG